MELEEVFGKVVKELRTEHNLSQEKLAEKCDLHVNYISFLERGVNQPSLKTIFSIALAFGIKPEELVAKVTKEIYRNKK
jgi:transcriptional regulator with XRE-family HTH domain